MGEELQAVLARLARFSFRKRWLMVFAIWLPLLLVFNSVSGFLGNNFHTDYTQPDSESKQVKDAFSRAGDKTQDGQPAQIVFRYPVGTDDPTVKPAMTSFFDDVASIEGVKVISPYDDRRTRVQQLRPAGVVRQCVGHRSIAGRVHQTGRADQGPRRPDSNSPPADRVRRADVQRGQVPAERAARTVGCCRRAPVGVRFGTRHGSADHHRHLRPRRRHRARSVSPATGCRRPTSRHRSPR